MGPPAALTMQVDAAAQGQVFLLSFLLGGILGLFYDLLRAIRRSSGRRGLSFLLDLLFWVTVSVLLFWVALFRESGEVRLYIPAAFLAGGTLYLVTLSPFVLPGLLQILEWLAKIGRWLASPAVRAVKTAKKVCGTSEVFSMKIFYNIFIIYLHFAFLSM